MVSLSPDPLPLTPLPGTLLSYVAGLSGNVDAVVLANSIIYDREIRYTMGEEREPANEVSFPGIPSSPRGLMTSGQARVEPSSLSSLADSRQLTLLALLPPLPVLLEFGVQDPVTYLRGGEQVIELVRNIYARQDAEDRVSWAVVDGGHEFVAGPIVEFLAEHLRGE